MRAVIVDPDGRRMEETRKLLEALGHQVVALVGDGVWAVSFCKKHKPELTVIDSVLPQLSCDRVIRAICRENATKYVIVGYTKMKEASAQMYEDPRIIALRRPFTAMNVEQTICAMSGIPRVVLPFWGTSRLPQLPRKP